MIEFAFNDDVTPNDCEEGIMLLHALKHTQRVRVYQRAYSMMSEAQKNFMLDKCLTNYKRAWENIQIDKNKIKFMPKCAKCSGYSGKNIYCEKCLPRAKENKLSGSEAV